MESYICALLNGHLYSDAVRLAEIYHAEVNNEDSLYHVALCYFKSRKINSSYQILSKANCTQSKCRLLLGQCCFELAKYHEAERALLGNEVKVDLIHNGSNSNNSNTNNSNSNNIINNNNINNNSNIINTNSNLLTSNNNSNNNCNNIIKEQLVKLYGNDSSAAIAAKYAGSIFEKTSRFKEAAEFFRISLELFPYMWGSAEALARLTDKTSTFTSRTNLLATALSKVKLADYSIQKQLSIDNYNNINNHHHLHHNNIISTNLIPNHHLQQTEKSTPSNEEYKTPQTRRAPGPVRREPRRSTRLYSIENNNETPATRPAIAGANAPAKKMRRADPELGLDSTAKIFLESFRGLDCLNQYKLDQAISILTGLPEKHRNSGWVLSCIARALYEKTNYNESVKYYEAARKLEPYRLEGMEYYSSALWHLHKEVELSILAKELMDFDQDAPETWCVAGNCYSLQKEHESAIKYLERAIKVDPNFAYAHTLLGHELISAERLDQAMTCFRNAVRLDPRHWNAWCGLGCIYYKNELYINAELYYKKALKIAPSNPVLMCQLAVVQHACKRSDAAIDTLTRALNVDPDNALCRFHRATIYSAIDKNKEALAELDELKRLVPKESMVYFLIGKIHKKTGNTHTALMNFSWAMELDPKGANNTIRDVIDKQHSGEDDVVVHRDQCVDA